MCAREAHSSLTFSFLFFFVSRTPFITPPYIPPLFLYSLLFKACPFWGCFICYFSTIQGRLSKRGLGSSKKLFFSFLLLLFRFVYTSGTFIFRFFSLYTPLTEGGVDPAHQCGSLLCPKPFPTICKNKSTIRSAPLQTTNSADFFFFGHEYFSELTPVFSRCTDTRGLFCV